MKTPKEDPADKAARLRERRISEYERTRAAQQNAQNLGTDIRSVYGPNMSLFRLADVMRTGPRLGGASSSKSYTQ